MSWAHKGVMARTNRGFTLVEIMIVVIIVAVMFAVALPSLRGVNDNNRLRASVRELTNLMKYARTEAVFSGRTTEVFLDTEHHEFWLDLRRPVERGSEKKKGSMERRRGLEKKVAFDAINAVEQNILKKGIIAVDFYPDGTASPTLISLKNDRETRYTVEVIRSTGQIEISKTDLDTVADRLASESYPLPMNYYDGMVDAGGGRR